MDEAGMMIELLWLCWWRDVGWWRLSCSSGREGVVVGFGVGGGKQHGQPNQAGVWWRYW